MYIYICIYIISKAIGINKGKEICLPNGEYISCHWCERAKWLPNEKYLWIAVKTSWQYEGIWLPKKKYLMGHRCEGTDMAHKCKMFLTVTLNFMDIIILETIQGSTKCGTSCVFWQLFLIFLAYIENFCVYYVILWSHTREKGVCLISQPPIGQFCLPWWVTWPLFILNDLDWSN